MRRFLVRRRFLRDADFDRRAVRIAEPEPVRLRTGRRVDAFDPQGVEPLAKAREVVLEGAERDELQLLARAFDDRAPAVRVAVGVEAQPVVLLAQVEAEARIKPTSIFSVR